MKAKIIIPIIVAVIIGGGVGYYCYTTVKGQDVSSTVVGTISSNNSVNSTNATSTSATNNSTYNTTKTTENSKNFSSDNSTNSNVSSTVTNGKAETTGSSSVNNSTISSTTKLTNNTSGTVSSSGNSSNNSVLNISSTFTNSELDTMQNFITSENISPLSGTYSLVINLNYYSIVNGVKYYEVYSNTIAGTNWNMGGVLTPNADGNYSQLSFKGYISSSGSTISEKQFLDGTLSFNLNNPTNLNDEDIYNMIRKIAIEYKEFFGMESYNFQSSLLNDYDSNLTINLNNTKVINGETYYEVEYVNNEPFYISLSGNIYLDNVSYLADVFNVPKYTNAQVAKMMKGI